MTLYMVCICQAEAIAYPEPGVAYDPSKFDTWSQHRGFQNPLEVGARLFLLKIVPPFSILQFFFLQLQNIEKQAGVWITSLPIFAIFARTGTRHSCRYRSLILCRWFRFAQLAKGKKFRP
jgi:hypothetical protein